MQFPSLRIAPSACCCNYQSRCMARRLLWRCPLIHCVLAVQGLNSKLYYENDDFRRVVSVVPTSAHTGEGIPDLLMLLVQLTQQLMSKKIMFANVVECTVLEVKTVEGLGTTVDVVLVNGALNRGDTIVLCGMNGPIVTQVRALLTPQPLRELRVKVCLLRLRNAWLLVV